MQQSPGLTPQQAGIQEARQRYERGILTFEQFQYAVNALLQAQTTEDCVAIIQELPTTTATSALHSPPQPSTPPAQVPTERIVGTIGELKRMRRPWSLGQHTSVKMWIGQVKLDLSLATLPQNGILDVFVPVGEAVIYVPNEVDVTVHAFALIGEVKAMGEERNGIFAVLKQEEFPAQGASPFTAPHLEIRLRTVMGSVKVKRVNGPVLAIKDLIKEAASSVLRVAFDATRQNRHIERS
jgi:hypothetical protein